MKVALSDSSSPSNLVLEGIFTIASLQLEGVSKSRIHQHRLISMLREKVTQIDRENVLRNLIATMLLYQYEVSFRLFIICLDNDADSILDLDDR